MHQIEALLDATGGMGILLGGYFVASTSDIEIDPRKSQEVARGQRFIARWQLRFGAFLLLSPLVVVILIP